MNDFIWILVGLTSFFVFIYGDIKAHKEGRYDPKIFRVAQGYERKIKYKISILGILFPVHFISDSTIADFYFLTLS